MSTFWTRVTPVGVEGIPSSSNFIPTSSVPSKSIVEL